MLIVCPECSKQISDKAYTCPGCGYPLNQDEPKPKKSEKKYSQKKMRLPNGFGRITEIKGRNLRKPFRVMVTTGTDKNGRPIGKLLKPNAYFKTYNEAYYALMEYNKDPFDLNKDITVGELYNEWLSVYTKTVSQGRLIDITSSWKYCKHLENMNLRDLKPKHIIDIMENGKKVDNDGKNHDIKPSTKRIVKYIFSAMLDYAMERELVNKNSARMITSKKELSNVKNDYTKSHNSYSKEELKILWENKETRWVDLILIQCYSGWRPNELLNILTEDVNIQEWTFKGGSKTESGRDRVVPIHSKIQALVKKHYDNAVASKRKYVFYSNAGTPISYKTFYAKCKKIIEELNFTPTHKPHDGRVTFVTLAKESKVDEYAIKRIVGHTITDLTERVYTDRSLDWLRNEIEKIE